MPRCTCNKSKRIKLFVTTVTLQFDQNKITACYENLQRTTKKSMKYQPDFHQYQFHKTTMHTVRQKINSLCIPEMLKVKKMEADCSHYNTHDINSIVTIEHRKYNF